MKDEGPTGDPSPSRLTRWFGSHPFRTILRIATAVAGASLIAGGLGVIWPKPDPMAAEPPSADDPASLAPLPERPVMVLVVGIDADGINDPNNKAAPKGPANADSLMLVQVSSSEPVQVLQLPTELAVNLPGRKTLQSLADAYPLGGVALTADVIAEVVGLKQGEPDRFVVIPRQALRSLVDGLGEVEVTLNQSYEHKDKAQNYSVNLQAGRQTLNGRQAEQLARYRPQPKNDQARRTRQQSLLKGIHEQLNQPNAIALLPAVIGEVSAQMETDLTPTEIMSLTAAALSSDQPPVISQLELAPRTGQQVMRELKPDQKLPLWPTPPDDAADN
ncbi:Transcriptional regulator LytR [Synechococcus sp. MIT S9509]|uniref:LCP family protein n=1 Tax=unclassified Synechococcus TaxID=2626047 RepID=UPI0007BAE63D|nr:MULTISPECIES: LCP family protein [unclassified Synechococcus]KZR85213.1 Transcriptional regulator LytR [Synechococcus sp. MIT S9504]KZR91254.1 Transcriptional regulator LytR [Synechococcus sp. MIT S9509]